MSERVTNDWIEGGARVETTVEGREGSLGGVDVAMVFGERGTEGKWRLVMLANLRGGKRLFTNNVPAV